MVLIVTKLILNDQEGYSCLIQQLVQTNINHVENNLNVVKLKKLK
jgi:hypothetical protein